MKLLELFSRIKANSICVMIAVRVRQGSRGQGLQRCEEAWHVRFGCTLPPLLRRSATTFATRFPFTMFAQHPEALCMATVTDGTMDKYNNSWKLTSIQGKAKYSKWKEVVDANTTQQEAEDKYVELGEQLLAKHDN